MSSRGSKYENHTYFRPSHIQSLYIFFHEVKFNMVDRY